MMQQLLLGQGGAAGITIGDVFSADLYTGNQNTGHTINNGINLSGEGGLVWIKSRSAYNNLLFDTERGVRKVLISNGRSAENSNATGSASLYQFNNNGFTIGSNFHGENVNNANYVAWTIRQASEFFDIVTWAGNGVNNRTISHNLGTDPGMIIYKNRDSSSTDWFVWHDWTAGVYGTDGQNYILNGTAAPVNYGVLKGVSSTNITVSNNAVINASNFNYVAYIFAKDTAGLIKCDEYTGNGSSTNGPTVNLGFEPGLLMIRRNAGSDWNVYDSARGVDSFNSIRTLEWNSADAEFTNGTLSVSSTGFTINSNQNRWNQNGGNYIYMAMAKP